MCKISSKTTPFESLTKQLSFTAGKLALVATLALGTSFTAAPAMASANQFLGLLGGAVGGGFIGNQFGKGSGRTIATAGGTVLGGLAGQSVGRSLDRGNAAYYGGGYGRGDRYNSGYSSNTVYYSEPAPQRVYYVPSYEQRVRRVEVVPQPVYVQPTTYVVDNSYGNGYGGGRNSGSYCREYNQGVTVGGRTQPSYGTACLQPDGSWQIQ